MNKTRVEIPLNELIECSKEIMDRLKWTLKDTSIQMQR